MKKKKIAVYDSRPDDLTTTAEAIREYFDRRGLPAEVAEYSEIYEFQCHFRDRHYDMVFLAMNSPLDLDAARSVAATDPACPMFFVSDTADYGLEGFNYCAKNYLLKPVATERVREVVEKMGRPRVLDGIGRR